MNYIKWILGIFIVLVFIAFLRVNSSRFFRRKLSLMTKILIALLFPILLLFLIFFGSLIILIVIGILIFLFILLLLFLIFGKGKFYYKKF
nr:hypothetical protein [Candidatus Woesearchaeota archaeon]